MYNIYMVRNGNTTEPMDAATAVHYENHNIPLRIKQYTMAPGAERNLIPHWHDDFELVHILSGTMEYRINDDRLIMSAGDFLFVNAREMHYNRRYGDAPVSAQCILFQPKLLTSNQVIQERYIEPVWINGPFEYLYYPKNTEQAKKYNAIMDRILELKAHGENGYEMEVIGHLHILMYWIYKELTPVTSVHQGLSYNTDIQKKMISFIYHRYSDKITLKDIAAAGNVSTHKCCDLFREYMSTTPVDFLNTYRMEVSTRLLANSDMSIIDIAQHCGIEQPAYFSKMFKDRFGLTPREYRRSRQVLHG